VIGELCRFVRMEGGSEDAHEVEDRVGYGRSLGLVRLKDQQETCTCNVPYPTKTVSAICNLQRDGRIRREKGKQANAPLSYVATSVAKLAIFWRPAYSSMLVSSRVLMREESRSAHALQPTDDAIHHEGRWSTLRDGVRSMIKEKEVRG
jgi:hypothetical protein